ncbi:hypothetical protein [Gorillibacterium timonense]|uniref:hypothetical protein n=1 Tax=Gorillibacterium timonense TaxID=1689269 RepID=UPI0016525E5A|nr:hypothetical protein [Gorillibacterium timonense]
MSKPELATQGCLGFAPIVCEPQVVVRDFYHPRPQPVIHPVEIVNRHHFVPVPQHYYTVTERNVAVPPLPTVPISSLPAGVSPFPTGPAGGAISPFRK